MKNIGLFFLVISYTVINNQSFAQAKDPGSLRVLGIDSISVKNADLTAKGKKKHSPRKASLYSAILPGLGQAYNRSYWKIPLVYAALGITGAVFKNNIQQYNKVRFAYSTLINKDTANFENVDAQFKNAVLNGNTYGLQRFRNQKRKDVDYTVLFFILFWGLNVVDATVDGHLKEFDVSNNLSFKIKPTINSLPNTVGLSIVFNIGKNNHRKTKSIQVQ